MAKLNGVKTIDMTNGEITKISYDGAEYAFVEGSPLVGDLIRPHTDEWGGTPSGFYVCESLDEDDDAEIAINTYGFASHYRRHYDVFRKTSASQTPSPLESRVDEIDKRVTALENPVTVNTVKREAKVGERILITDASSAQLGLAYKNGDILTVTSMGVLAPICGNYETILDKEYEVIVEEAQSKPQPAQSITHGGEEYTLVDRKAQAGDVVVITANTNYSRNKVGDIGKVVEAGYNDSHSVSVDVPGRTGTNGNYTRFNEMRLATEAERAQYEKAVEDAKKPELKVGDTVEVIDGSESRYGDLKTRAIGEVTDIYGLFTKEPIEVTTDDDFDRFPASALRKVDKPSVFTKLGRKPNEYKAGDIVRVINTRRASSRKVGEYVVVCGPDGTNIPLVRYADGATYFAEVELIAPVESRVDRE